MSGVLCILTGGGAGALTARVSPSFNSGSSTLVPGTVNTPFLAVCSVSGGVPPYEYEWVYVSGDTQIQANSPNASSTHFSAYFPSSGTYSAVFKCVVTDALSTAVDSNNVSIQLTAGDLT